jgi:hypothetical protein
MRSRCDENNEVLGNRIGAKRDLFNINLKHKTLKVRINISAAFQQKVFLILLQTHLDSPYLAYPWSLSFSSVKSC